MRCKCHVAPPCAVLYLMLSVLEQLYREDESTGEISLALSSDSSCTNHLRTSADGYETLTLRPRARPTEWPGERCRLPDWAQGKWEHLHVDGDTIVLKDQRNFKTYEARCVSAARQDDEERFLLYARTQCGDEHYKCVWVKNRGSNAMEFQIGKCRATTETCSPAVSL